MSKIKGKQIDTGANGIDTPNLKDGAVSSTKVDASVMVSSGANPFTGDANLGAHKLSNVANGVAAQDAVTVTQLNAAIAGAAPHAAALVLADANLVLSGEQTIQGVLTSASRVALSAQTNPIENGLWLTAAGAWTRPLDFANGYEAGGSYFAVLEGTYADEQWIVTTAPPNDVVGTNGLTLQLWNRPGSFPRPVTQNKNMTALVTASDGDLATSSTVFAANAYGGYFGVRVNGVEYVVGDATKVSVDCYVSGDGGATARAMAAIAAGDALYWNGSVAGFQLATIDRIDFDYQAKF